MKSKAELNALKEEVETENRKFHSLTEDELAQVSGGQEDQGFESMEGITYNDIMSGSFKLNGVMYNNSWCMSYDSNHRLCYIYGAEDNSGFVLLPIS